MDVSSRVRALKRRVRCARVGHYWLQRMDGNRNVEVFCRRSGRRDTSSSRTARPDVRRSP